jgi:hypothetical protein
MDDKKVETKKEESNGKEPNENKNEDKVQFSQKVDKAINELMPNSEVYDDPSFDPINYINEKFPNGFHLFL